jgi:OmpA-OmpF porin, OOP family
MKVMVLSKFLLLAAFWLFSAASIGADLAGSADHPLISRYGDSRIIGYQQEEYGETEFPTGAAYLREGVRGFASVKRLEGKRTRLLYEAPAQRTSFEVMTNYKDAIDKAGGKTIWECADLACGPQMAFTLYFDQTSKHKLQGNREGANAYSMNAEEPRYLAAVIDKPDGTATYVLIFSAMQENAANTAVGRRVATFVEIVETKAMAQNMVSVNAENLRKGLESEGKIALYGIFFDTDKAVIKAESKPQLDEMAALLKRSLQLKVYIVGHTDNQGALDYNRSLSQRRAESVVSALVRDYGIAINRLSAQGVANLAPVANNASEAGRAKNRRVELVLQ